MANRSIVSSPRMSAFPATVRGVPCRRLAVQFSNRINHSDSARVSRIGSMRLCATSGKDVEIGAEKLEGTNGVQPEECVEYPYETDAENGGFFPRREPGDFPPVEVNNSAVAIPAEEEFDPLRDGPLRFLGYANELGEAFAAWLPVGGVPLSYAIAIGYVCVDTGDKGIKAFSKAEKELAEMPKVHPEVDCGRLTALLAGERALDTIVWQLLASVAIPGATIHTVVAIVHALLVSGLGLDDADNMLPAAAAAFASIGSLLHTDPKTVAELVEKSVPTFSGLIAIPFIVHPIDNTVHAMLNVSLRPALRRALCGAGQGELAGLTICDEQCIVKDFPILSDESSIVDAFRQSMDEEDY